MFDCSGGDFASGADQAYLIQIAASAILLAVVKIYFDCVQASRHSQNRVKLILPTASKVSRVVILSAEGLNPSDAL